MKPFLHRNKNVFEPLESQKKMNLLKRKYLRNLIEFYDTSQDTHHNNLIVTNSSTAAVVCSSVDIWSVVIDSFSSGLLVLGRSLTLAEIKKLVDCVSNQSTNHFFVFN